MIKDVSRVCEMSRSFFPQHLFASFAVKVICETSFAEASAIVSSVSFGALFDRAVQNETGRQLSWHRLREASGTSDPQTCAGPKNAVARMLRGNSYRARSYMNLVEDRLGTYTFLVQAWRLAVVFE